MAACRIRLNFSQVVTIIDRKTGMLTHSVKLMEQGSVILKFNQR
ncbi:hypothetical protein FB480_102436 [Agrobacterium vitis]|nr:hypothetical protein FB480_102436 [Agrobacterium vitis]